MRPCRSIVRGGAILPVQPLVQSTDETPSGPLTLRVYPPVPGGTCSGSVYADDGHSLSYRNGDYFRMNATCSVTESGAVTVTLAPTEGRYKPWFQQLRVEVVGSQTTLQHASVDGKETALDRNGNVSSVILNRNAKGSRISFQ